MHKDVLAESGVRPLSGLYDRAESGIRELAPLDRRLEELIHRDDRGAFTECVGHYIQRARSSILPVGLLLLGIDRLNELVDELGPQAGYQAVTWTARLLSSAARIGDLRWHLELNQLALVMPNVTRVGVERVCKTVRSNLALGTGRPPLLFRVPILISLGAALAPFEAESASELMVGAETAMYRNRARRRFKAA